MFLTSNRIAFTIFQYNQEVRTPVVVVVTTKLEPGTENLHSSTNQPTSQLTLEKDDMKRQDPIPFDDSDGQDPIPYDDSDEESSKLDKQLYFKYRDSVRTTQWVLRRT